MRRDDLLTDRPHLCHTTYTDSRPRMTIIVRILNVYLLKIRTEDDLVGFSKWGWPREGVRGFEWPESGEVANDVDMVIRKQRGVRRHRHTRTYLFRSSVG